MARKYPDDNAFHMAPNAGIMDDKGVKATAESHASNMPDFGIGKKTTNAMYKDWANNDYVMKQDGDGSMNYMEEKTMIRRKDNARISRTMAKPGDAV